MPLPLSTRLLIAYLMTLAVVQALFAAFPQIDLAVSHLFADGPRGFVWAGTWVETLNLVVRRMGEGLLAALILGFLWGWLSGRLKGPALRAWAYVPLCVGLSSGLIVNLGLKETVGRARPAHLAEFGGAAQFSPPWQVVTECARNCSFTSGEVALAAALAIPLLALVVPHLARRRARVAALGLGVAYVALVAGLRIGLGRHFLSDALFATLISGGVALVLHAFLRLQGQRLDPACLFRSRDADPDPRA